VKKSESLKILFKKKKNDKSLNNSKNSIKSNLNINNFIQEKKSIKTIMNFDNNKPDSSILNDDFSLHVNNNEIKNSFNSISEHKNLIDKSNENECNFKKFNFKKNVLNDSAKEYSELETLKYESIIEDEVNILISSNEEEFKVSNSNVKLIIKNFNKYRNFDEEIENLDNSTIRKNNENYDIKLDYIKKN